MKRLFVLPFVFVFSLALPSCAKTPPNLTPQAVVAFHGTQVIHYLDRVRDAANDAHKTTPPLLDAKTTLTIVQWHEATIKVVHEAAAGWQAATLKALDELPKQLSAHDQQVVAPYIAAAKVILQQVTQ